MFALQYLGSVEVLEPEALRQELLEELRGGVEKYSGNRMDDTVL